MINTNTKAQSHLLAYHQRTSTPYWCLVARQNAFSCHESSTDRRTTHYAFHKPRCRQWRVDARRKLSHSLSSATLSFTLLHSTAFQSSATRCVLIPPPLQGCHVPLLWCHSIPARWSYHSFPGKQSKFITIAMWVTLIKSRTNQLLC